MFKDSKNTASYSSDRNTIAFLLVISVLIILLALFTHLKTTQIQNEISEIHKKLLLTENTHQQIAQSIKDHNQKNEKAVQATKNHLNNLEKSSQDLLLKISNTIETLQSDIKDIKNADANIYEIERYPASNDIIIKKQAQTLETSYSGIGIKFKKTSDAFIVLEIFSNSPAQHAGLYAGDKVIEIDGLPTKNMDVQIFNKKVRGKTGTTVDLTYIPAGSLNKIEKVTITRAIIDLKK